MATRPRQQSQDSKSRKTINKAFLPQNLKTDPPLPAIHEFRLDYILNHQLKQQSQEVRDSLLKVGENYRADLKNEIRNKLSIEQKIQYKNIDISKGSRKLNRSLASANRRLSRVVDTKDPGSMVDLDLSSVLELAASTSSMVKSLAASLSEISGVPDSKQYPYLARYFAPAEERDEEERDQEVEEQEQEHHEANSYRTQDNNIEGPEELEEVTEPETAGKHAIETELTEIDPLETGPVGTAVTELKEAILVKPSSVSSPSRLDSYIALLKSSRAPRVATKQVDISDPEDFELFMSQAINRYRDVQQTKYKNVDIFGETPEKAEIRANPLDFLYPSLGLAFMEPLSLKIFGPNLMRIKSRATVELTPQLTHFKKLRINGSPITPKKFEKEQVGEEKEPDLLARKSLFESLGIDHEIDTNESPDNYSESSSDDHIDGVLDQEVSTDDSSALDSALDSQLTTSTNKYYAALLTDIERRKKKRRPQTRRKDVSPTPKFLPAHHTLKPLKSILKLPKKGRVRSKPNSSSSPIAKPPITDSPTLLSNTTVLSLLKDYTNGTLLPENGESISKLKHYLDAK